METHQGYTFDWKSRHDPASLAYQIPTKTIGRGYRMWTNGPILDQGQDGYCVGYGIAAELLANPIAVGLPTSQFAAGIFHLALKFDDIPGEADDTGTSVLAGAKAAHKMGLISEYRWCFGIDEVARGIYNHGPVVVGTPWLDSMMEPEWPPGWDAESPKVPNAPVLDISGSEVGGHCYLVTGYTLFGNTEWFKIVNSWGKSWGRDGTAYIRKDDLAKLLRGTGEACILFDNSVSPFRSKAERSVLQRGPYGMEIPPPEAGAYLPSQPGM